MDRESELIESIRHGNSAAFEALVKDHVDGVYRFARSLTGNDADAEDLTQETLLDVERSLKKFRSECSLRSWLRKIAYRRFMRSQSRSKREEPIAEDVKQPSGGADFHIDLDRALGQLSSEQRAAFILAEIEQFDLAEIAAALEVPVGTVKSRLSRAKSALRLTLSDGYPEECYALVN